MELLEGDDWLECERTVDSQTLEPGRTKSNAQDAEQRILQKETEGKDHK